jgi:hypothetical protein
MAVTIPPSDKVPTTAGSQNLQPKGGVKASAAVVIKYY